MVSRRELRTLQDSLAGLAKQMELLDETLRALRKQVKRLKRAEPESSKPVRIRAARAH